MKLEARKSWCGKGLSNGNWDPIIKSVEWDVYKSLDFSYKEELAQFLFSVPSLLFFLSAWNADVMPGGRAATLQLRSYKQEDGGTERA